MNFRLIIQTNSPGELSNWAYPITEEFNALFPDGEIWIALTPCQYASGQEQKIASGFKSVTRVLTPKESFKWAFLNWGPFKASDLNEKKKPGVVLYLGGDPAYAKRIAKQMGYPVYAYSEKENWAVPGFKKIFYRDQVGDLMSYKASAFNKDRSSILQTLKLQNQLFILFLPGSRKAHFEALMPLYLDTIALLKTEAKELTPLIGIAPFVSKESLNKFVPKMKLSKVRYFQGHSIDLFYISQFAISIPGTNTAEAMYMKTPTLVLLPTNRPDLIIFDGLLGILTKIPGFGWFLQQLAMLGLKMQKNRFFALPNMMFKKEIFPEIRGELYARRLADEIKSFHSNTRNWYEIRQFLESIPVKTGAKEIILEMFDSLEKKILKEDSEHSLSLDSKV